MQKIQVSPIFKYFIVLLFSNKLDYKCQFALILKRHCCHRTTETDSAIWICQDDTQRKRSYDKRNRQL